MSSSIFGRRRVLKGMLAGSAVTVGLPLLECMMKGNFEAFAADGAALPPIFGTYFWPLGLSTGFWEPKTLGPKFELPPQLAPLAPFKDRLNVISGMQVFLDGKVNVTHNSGPSAIMTGTVPPNGASYGTSLDVTIGNAIGKKTRFRSLEVACDGNPKSSWSARGASGRNPAEISPLALYTRVFGPEFKDPNAADFVPDPEVMVRKSALSAVMDERQALMRNASAYDRQRLDDYFSSVRDLEQKLAIELERPVPMKACSKPLAGKDAPQSGTLEDALANHELFAPLLAHALACGQTQVFNVSISQGMSGLRTKGDVTTNHIYTHEEPVDPELGYSPKCHWFGLKYMKALSDFVAALDKIKEGDKTLLDRSSIYVFTDHTEPRVHSLHDYAFFTMGSGNGRIKTGLHVSAHGDPVTRLGLTLQRALGLAVESWGTESNLATKPISEMMV